MMTVPVWGKFNVEKIFTYNTSTPEGISYEELYPTLVSRWSPLWFGQLLVRVSRVIGAFSSGCGNTLTGWCRSLWLQGATANTLIFRINTLVSTLLTSPPVRPPGQTQGCVCAIGTHSTSASKVTDDFGTQCIFNLVASIENIKHWN